MCILVHEYTTVFNPAAVTGSTILGPVMSAEVLMVPHAIYYLRSTSQADERTPLTFLPS